MRKQIIVDPEKFKPCCDENITADVLFNRIFKEANIKYGGNEK